IRHEGSCLCVKSVAKTAANNADESVIDSLAVAVDDSTTVSGDVDATEDPWVARNRRFAGAAPLVLVVVDAHPRLSSVDRSEDTTHACDLRRRVKRHVSLSDRGFAKTNVVSFLHVCQLREARSRVGGMP